MTDTNPPAGRTAEAACNIRVYGEDDFPCCAPRSNHQHHGPMGDETEPAHSIQVGAYEPEGLSCICGFTPRGEGSHALTIHLMNAATAAMSARVEELERQAEKVRAFIDERAQFIQVLRNYRGEDNGDYIRWTGHAEARRVLAESMGIELDKETGGIRKPAAQNVRACDHRQCPPSECRGC
jgi:hypothetical protein